MRMSSYAADRFSVIATTARTARLRRKSGVTRPPGFRMTMASLDMSPSTWAGSARWSAQHKITVLRLGSSAGRLPKWAAAWARLRSVNVARVDMGFLLRLGSGPNALQRVGPAAVGGGKGGQAAE